MGNITLPGYESILDNSVFGKPVHGLPHPGTGEIEGGKRIICLTRFRVPTEEELRGNMRKLMLESILDISDHELNKCIELSFNHYKRELQEEGIYVEALSGLLPERILDIMDRYLKLLTGPLPKEILDIVDRVPENRIIAGDYKTAVKEASIQQIIRIRIEKDIMPTKKELEYLLERGVRESDVLSISIQGEARGYETAADLARLVNGALQSPKLITLLEDTSDGYIKKKRSRNSR